MATAQELQDQYDALEQKRADLYNRMQSLSDQHASSRASLLGHDFAAMDKIRFNSALQPLRAQDRVLHQQQAALKSELLRADRDAKIALGAPAAAAKAQLAAQKAQADARKLASTNLEDQSARAFGLGPKKGIDYVTQQGAFYDPSRGAIAVPDTKSAKVAAQKAQKGDAAAGKQVQAEITGFAKQAGVQGPVSPESFFGDNGFDMEPDKDGNYVYDANGTQVTIPEETAKRLQEQYNSSLAPAQESAQLPTTGVKYIPVDTFNQANQALAQVKGVPVPNPVERFLQSNQAGREAQPAINAALLARDSGLRPATVPSVDQTAGLTNIAGARIAPTDISTGVRILDQAAYNQSGVDPIFAKIAADREAARRVPMQVGQQVSADEGASGSIKDLAALNKAAIDAGAQTPEQRNAFIRGRVAQKQQEESQLPVQGQPFVDSLINAAGNDAAVLGPAISSGYSYLQRAASVADPLSPAFVANALRGKLEQVGEKTLPITVPMIAAGYRALQGPTQDDIAKKYFAAKGSNEIGPDVTLEDFAQRYNPTNATSTPELQVP